MVGLFIVSLAKLLSVLMNVSLYPKHRISMKSNQGAGAITKSSAWLFEHPFFAPYSPLNSILSFVYKTNAACFHPFRKILTSL